MAGSMEVILRLMGSRRREREKKLPAAYFNQLPKKRYCLCCRGRCGGDNGDTLAQLTAVLCLEIEVGTGPSVRHRTSCR